ncbi:DapH/DapD/GlmU-related protein [uncultured Paracoccus sp.]|uniref:DapH/DapD/GlmU-related protein n=1 Tax=uncultured Paracoccus sp. TaxID=189685 RepID=UPI0026162E30|nr:DapH/DapD/GlmU-related protein [uncultured Paracoccus sp.]
MFTGNTVTLSDLAGPLELDVRRDAAIAYVGKVPTRLDQRLVPCGKQAHLNEAAGQSGIAAYVVPEGLAPEVASEAGLVVSAEPAATAMRVHEYLAALPNFQWADFDTRIDPTAVISPGAHVAPRNVVIGARSVIGPNAVLLERSIIGADCEIGPGTVVGGEAFEQCPGAAPKRILRQTGGVLIEDWVTIQALGTIVRATFGGFTRVRRETKMDAHVHVAHDCQIGERVTITACAEISGRVEIGDDAYLGPNCTISNGVRIGRKATITIGSVVVRDVPDGIRVTGNFALPHENWLNLIRAYR